MKTLDLHPIPFLHLLHLQKIKGNPKWYYYFS